VRLLRGNGVGGGVGDGVMREGYEMVMTYANAE